MRPSVRARNRDLTKTPHNGSARVQTGTQRSRMVALWITLVLWTYNRRWGRLDAAAVRGSRTGDWERFLVSASASLESFSNQACLPAWRDPHRQQASSNMRPLWLWNRGPVCPRSGEALRRARLEGRLRGGCSRSTGPCVASLAAVGLAQGS